MIQYKIAFEKSERSQRMCELHTILCMNPENATAAAERQAIFEEINDEALAELEEIDRQIRAGERQGYFPAGRPGHE